MNENNVERLALGTVQLGMAYGIANAKGRPDLDEASSLIRAARGAGIATLDTAIAYGDSESRLGDIGVDGFQLVTKLPPLPDGVADVAGWVRQQFDGSLARLGCDGVYGFLLHRPADLLGAHGRALARALSALQDEGRAEKIGVSVYDCGALPALEAVMPIGLVQLPFNVFDRRLTNAGCLDALKARDVEIHVRSIFLQGLLVSEAAGRKPCFAPWRALLASWWAWLEAERLSPLAACVRFAMSHAGIDKVVVGCDNSAQLMDIVRAAAGAPLAVPASLCSGDEGLINPGAWADR